MLIENADVSDGTACSAVYAPYVLDTAVTFELVPPTAEQMSARIAAAGQAHAWLVARDEGRVRGYAYGGPFHTRPAYRWSCEVSVYLEPGLRRCGLGRALYTELFERLAARGFRTAMAGMTLPNEASEGLHHAMGFTPVGVLRRIGWKLGAWHDVAWCQRTIGVASGPPGELQ